MWSRSLLAGAVALVVTALGVPAAAQDAIGTTPCKDSIGVALVDVPQQRQTDPRARTYIVDHVEPGTSFERRIRVCNGTAAPVAVQLYAGAASIDGDAFTAVEGRVHNELSRWIDVEPGQVTVPANGEILATARVTVPSDATAGERYAAVLVEAPAVRQAGGFSVANRVGVRVYLSVGGPREPASDFVVDSLQASRRDDGRPMVTARVRNTGERALDMRGELSLTDGPGGLSAGPFPATVGTTLGIGESGPVEVVLDGAISGGPWTATIAMRSGTLERRAQAQITFPEASGTANPAVPAKNLPLREDPRLLIPIAGSLILLALLLLFLLWKRRRNNDDDEPEHSPGLVPA